ncbi:MAG: alpha/beta hydrolase [Rickettsiales bacterium]|nr:alpha/beta hydrolase [Rickettsiales bacterium]
MSTTPRSDYFNAPNLDGSGTHKLHFLDWDFHDHDHTVVCVHGLTRNARDFEFLANKLCKHYRVISIDIAGRGQSEWFEDSANYHYGTYVTDCLAFLDNFHLRNVSWVGTSMGGIIGMMIAAQKPDRIKKMILNDVGAFIPKEALKRIVKYVSAVPNTFDSKADAEAILRENYKSFGLKSDEEWQHMLNHSIQEAGDGTYRLAYDPTIMAPIRLESNNFEDINDVDLSELWEKVRTPTLIIRGAESDLLQKETVSAMRSTHIKATSIEIEGAGHAPALMNNEQTEMVRNWLQRPGALSQAIPA